MKWSPQQERALDDVARWIAAGDRPVFRMFGYAGTGKTTLAMHLAGDMRTWYCAYTGKAASVMRAAGCAGARTIHSSIYKPAGSGADVLRSVEAEVRAEELRIERKLPPDHPLMKKLLEAKKNAKRLTFVLDEDSLVRSCELIVVDECSMVDEKVGSDLQSFGVPILVLGDPEQLPPIYGGGYFTNHRPDVLLTEIHRQALDSPVLRIATEIRQGRPVHHGEYGSSRVIRRDDLETTDARDADQILVGLNRTRRSYNRRMRQILGHTHAFPRIDERLVCLRNDREKGIYNGGTYRVVEQSDDLDDDGGVSMTVQSDEVSATVSVHPCFFDEYFRTGAVEEVSPNELRGYDEFDYAYALTVHKSQGSQWNNVLLFDESGAFRQDQRRWLYTGVTRASEKITIVRG